MLGPLLGAAPPQPLADAMHRAWIRFAKTGGPGWPNYGLTSHETMRFDETSRVVQDPRAWERRLWNGVR